MDEKKKKKKKKPNQSFQKAQFSIQASKSGKKPSKSWNSKKLQSGI